MIENFDDTADRISQKDQLIEELKNIIHEYENRLSVKDTNFQLQFSELQNELIGKESDLAEVNIEKQKLEYELLELHDLVDEHNLIIKSKDIALQIIQDDLKNQLENVKSHYNETLSIRQEEIESLRLTGSQLREQLVLRENDMIQVMQRHENQIINLFNEINTKTEHSDVDQMVKILKDQITNLREALVEKQHLLKITNDKLETQDQIIRQLQETNLNLEEQAKQHEQMSYTDQSYQKHIETLNETIKENKKKQLTFKAKVKLLEKQLASLKVSTLNEDKENPLKNELIIRDEIITKQNILIDELRQTENNLRQSLNRSIAIQEEQILELKYWENFNNILPSFDFIEPKDLFSTEPLSMAIEKLESFWSFKSKKKKHELQDIIKELCHYRTSVDQQNKYFSHLEIQIKLLKNCVTNVNKLNINLNKHIGILVADYQQSYKYLKDFDEEMDNLTTENLDQCSNTELVKKIIIISNQIHNSCNRFLELENENLGLNLEINKIIETCDVMCLKIENTFQDIESFLLTKKDDSNKLNFFDKTKDKSESFYVEEMFKIILERNIQIKNEIEQNNNKSIEKNNKINENLCLEVKKLQCNLNEKEVIIDNKMKKLENLAKELEESKVQMLLLEEKRDNNESIISELTTENILLKTKLENLQDKLLLNCNETIKMNEKLDSENAKFNEQLCQLNSENIFLKALNEEISINELKLKYELESISKKVENNEIKIQTYQKEKEDNFILTEELNKDLSITRNELEKFKINEIQMKESISKISNDYANILNELEDLKKKENLKADEKCDLSDRKYLNNELLTAETAYIAERNKDILAEQYLITENLTESTLDYLKHKVKLIEKELETSCALINSLENENKSLKFEIENLSEFKSNLEIELQMNNNNLNLFKNEKIEIEISLMTMKEENMKLKKEFNEIQKSEIQLKDVLKISEEKASVLKMFEDQSNIIKSIEQENEENEIKLTNLIDENGSLREQLNENLNNLNNIIIESEYLKAQNQKEKDDNFILINERNSEIVKLQNNIIEMIEFEETLKNEINTISIDKGKICDNFENIKIKSIMLEQKVEENEILIENTNKVNSSLTKDIENLNFKVTHLSEKLIKVTKNRDDIIKEKEDYKNRIMNLEQEQTKLNEKLNEMNNNEVNLKEKITIFVNERDMKVTDYYLILKELEDIKYKYEILEIKSKENEKLLLDFSNENTILNNNLTDLKNHLVKISDEKNSLLDKFESSQKQMKDLIFENLHDENRKLQKEIDSLNINKYKLEENILILNQVNAKELENLSQKLAILEKANEDKEVILTNFIEENKSFKQIIDELNKSEKKLGEENLNYLNKITDINKKLIIEENEKLDRDSMIINLRSEIANLKETIENKRTQECVLQEKILNINKEKDKLLEEYDNLKFEENLLETVKTDNLSLIQSLDGQINLLQGNIAEANDKKLKLEEDIEAIKKEKDVILSNLENVTEKYFLLEKEKETLINDLEHINVNHIEETEQLNNYIVDIKEGLKNLTLEKHDFIEEIKILKVNVRTYERENEDNLSLIKDLNHQLIMLKQMVEELSANEEFLKQEVMVLTEEKIDLMKNLEILKSKMEAKYESITSELKEEIVQLKDAELKMKYEYKHSFKEKDDLSKELAVLKNSLSSLNDEKSSLLNELTREKNMNAEKASMSKHEINNNKEELQSTSDDLLKDKEVLEKNYFILKAKFLKFKKQSEERINQLTKQNEEFSKFSSIKDIGNGTKTISLETVDSFCQCNILDSSWFTQDMTKSSEIFPSSNSPKINFDENSLFNQIENFSHEVNAKVRKVNFEIEEFLERNERVTSSLVSKCSPDRNSSSSDIQSEKLLLKNRELSLTIKNLQEQNMLMKNKIIDICNCLEKEQELYKQLNEEKIVLIDNLTNKLNLTTNENFQLNLQINNVKEELKLTTKEKQKCLEKVNGLKEELSNLTLKVSNLSSENSQITEDYRLLKLKSNQELYLKLDQLQSDLNFSETINTQNKTTIIELEKCKFDLKKANNKLSIENNEILQSRQVIINELLEKCRIHELNNEILNNKITELEEINNSNLNFINSLRERINCLEILIQTQQADGFSDYHLLESIRSLTCDMEKFNSKLSQLPIKNLNAKYTSVARSNRKIYDQIHNCFIRISDIESQIQIILNERNDLQIKIKLMELDHIQIVEIKETECRRLKQLISDYEFALNNENSFKKDGHEEIVLNSEMLSLLKSKIEFEQKNIQNYILNKLKDTFSINTTELKVDLENNFENDFTNYLEIIKNSILNHYSIKEMKNAEIQTNIDLTYLQKLQTEIAQTNYKWQNFDEFSVVNESISEDFIGNIISCNNLMELMRNKVTKLQKDLEIEEIQKCEMSDKFEQIITELESACDAEVEKLKLNNEFYKQEINLLKSEREEQDSNINLLKNQIFSLQLEMTKSNLDFEKNNLIDVSVETTDSSLSWICNLNDALKQTIAEKEDQITELMKELNESFNKLKEATFNEESHHLEIQNLNNKLHFMSDEIKLKDKSIQDNLDVINELEVICVEKENRVSSLEKELTDINNQLEQYISAVCSMQARLEASKPNIESMMNKIDSRSNNLQLLNLIDQLEKDYAEELEQSEISKSKIEMKLNKAIHMIYKLKKQLKQCHAHVLHLNEEIKSLKSNGQYNKNNFNNDKDTHSNIDSTFVDVSTQIDFESSDSVLYKEENADFKGIIENLHVNNFILWRELDKIQNNDRNSRGSSLPPTSTGSVHTIKSNHLGSERSLSPVSQISSNSFEGDSINFNRIKDLQRKLQRTNQQLNQMRIERNRIHQEYTRIRQLKEESDQKLLELSKHINSNFNQDILHEKDELIEMNNKYSVKIVELQAEIEMINVRNSILETKCKKMEWKLNNQRRKYDQLLLKLDEKEQEIDHITDELRKNISIFEKDRLDWLKEKKELKLLNKNKDDKIVELRKKLSNKNNETTSNIKADKEEITQESIENDYVLEIEQLSKQLSQLKQENKQYLIQHRDELSKYKGQLEELMDDNKQLKRKLALDKKNSKMNFVEKKINNPLIHIIDEVSETSDSIWNNTESNTILAKVVLEKENLINLLADAEKQLNDEKQKSFAYHQEIIQFKNNIMKESNIANKVFQFTQYEKIFEPTEESNHSSSNNLNFSLLSNKSLDKATETYNVHVIHKFTETSENYELEIIEKLKSKMIKNNVNQYVQTEWNFDKQIIDDYQLTLFNRLNIHRCSQIDCFDLPVYASIEIQTETNKQLQIFLSKDEQVFHSIGIQTNDDILNAELFKEINLQSKIAQDSSREIQTLQKQIDQFNYELNEAGKKITLIENQNLDYQETIGKLQLDNIEIDKKYKQCLGELNLKIGNYKELNDNKNKLVVQSENESSQVNELQLADGWDMEWEYEKIANDTQNADNPVNETDNKFVNFQKNCLSKFLIELDVILNLYSDNCALSDIKNLISMYKSVDNFDHISNQELFNNDSILNLVAILREEITQLKQTLNERNNEIGQLKCLRNQLQADLLESGQQIKDSNMEFLNLKESIQVVNTEKNMLQQKSEDLEIRFKQFVNFIQMLGFDLRRLRDSSPSINESLSGNNVIDEQNVLKVTKSMEHELHKLLEQMHEKDIKLHKSINQIEQLSCAIQRLQLNQKSIIVSDNNINEVNAKKLKHDNSLDSNNHEECENLHIELSELLEKKQNEIEELRSRLFLATDQLIHFRAFFADPDNKLKPEYLPINETMSPKWKSFSEKIVGDLHQHHIKVLVESEDDDQFSDSDDQLMFSQGGSTVIKVEKTERVRAPCSKTLFTRVCGQIRYKTIMNSLKSAVSASRGLFFFRSQPRLNFKTLLIFYIMFIHVLLLRCIFS